MRGLVSRTACVVAVVIAAAMPPVAEARIPDWAKAIAEAAPTIGPEIPPEPTRVLLDETTVTVQPDGRYELRMRRAIQVLRSDAGRFRIGKFHYDETTCDKVRSRAWHLPPFGRGRRNREDAVDVTLSDDFLTDSRTRWVHVDDTAPGSLVFFEFEAVVTPYDLTYDTSFGVGVRVDRSRFTLTTPPGWTVRFDWLHADGPDPEVRGETRIWELRDLEPVAVEPLGEDPNARQPRLVVAFDPPADARVSGVALRDWTALGSWFESIAGDRRAVTPAISEAAKGIAADGEAGALRRTRETAKFVRDRVRYVAKELGIGGLRPHPASEVLEHLYGDCKDKATLLQAMLASEGQRSYGVLVNLTTNDTVSSSVPSMGAFNHFIVAVPLPADVPVPNEVSGATVEAGSLGRLLIVDPTDEYAAIGTLSSDLAGKTGLVLADRQSALVRLPEGRAEDNRVERRLEAEIGPDGTIAATLVTTRRGESATRARRAWRDDAEGFRKATARALDDVWPRVAIEDQTVEDEAADGAFVETARLRLVPLRGVPAPKLLAVFPGALGELPRVSLGRRETAVVYEYPRTLRYASVVHGIPEGTPAPSGDEASGDGWSAVSQAAVEGDTLTASSEVVLSRRRFEPDAFRELKKLWVAARRATGADVQVRP